MNHSQWIASRSNQIDAFLRRHRQLECKIALDDLRQAQVDCAAEIRLANYLKPITTALYRQLIARGSDPKNLIEAERLRQCYNFLREDYPFSAHENYAMLMTLKVQQASRGPKAGSRKKNKTLQQRMALATKDDMVFGVRISTGRA